MEQAIHGKPRSVTGRKLALVASYACVAVAVLWSRAPLYWMLSTSFKGKLAAAQLDPTLIAQDPAWQNYAGLAGGSLPFMRFMNSVFSCLLATIVAVVIALPAAYALSRARFRAANRVGYVILLVRMFPMVVLLAPLYLVLTFTGQFKTDRGGMMAASTVTTLLLMIAFFAVQRSMVRGLTAGSVTGT